MDISRQLIWNQESPSLFQMPSWTMLQISFSYVNWIIMRICPLNSEEWEKTPSWLPPDCSVRFGLDKDLQIDKAFYGVTSLMTAGGILVHMRLQWMTLSHSILPSKSQFMHITKRLDNSMPTCMNVSHIYHPGAFQKDFRLMQVPPTLPEFAWCNRTPNTNLLLTT